MARPDRVPAERTNRGHPDMKLRYSIAASLMAISVATIVAAPAQAQQITTGIEGQVNDDGGAAIGGATVVITDTRTGAARTITTGADGRFSTTGLTTGGPYTVSVNAASYEGQARKASCRERGCQDG